MIDEVEWDEDNKKVGKKRTKSGNIRINIRWLKRVLKMNLKNRLNKCFVKK